MAKYIEGFRTNPNQSIYLDGVTRTGLGSILFFDPQTGADPISAAATRGLFVDSSNRLSYWNGTSAVRLTGPGGAATTWEDIYGVDTNFNITANTWTITQSSANPILTLNKTNAGAGAVINITNAGSGADVIGTSSTWQVSAAGAAEFQTSVTTPAVVSYAAGADAALTLDGKGSGKVTINGTGTGNIELQRNVTMPASRTFTMAGVDGSTEFTLTAGDVVYSNGSLAITDTDNAASFSLTNNTASTIGNASSTGVVTIASTSLTTGALVNLQLTEGTLIGGWYLRLWDATAAGVVWSVGEDGLTTITGAGGSDMFVLSAGDQLISDGSITLVDADNAASLFITNNTADTVGAAASTGVVNFVSTSLTTGALLNLELTEATLAGGWYLRAWDATAAAAVFSVGEDGAVVITDTSVSATPLTIVANSATTVTTGLINIDANALSTGNVIKIDSTSTALTSGEMLNIDLVSSGTLAAKTGNVVSITTSMTHTDNSNVTENFNDLTISRTVIRNTGGADANATTSQGSMFAISNTITATTGTINDTVNGISVTMSSGGSGSGIVITHGGTTAGYSLDIAASATTGTVIRVVGNALTTTGIGMAISSTGVGMTSGSLLRVTSATAAALATNGIVSFAATGAFTSTAVTDGFVKVLANATQTGTIANISGTAVTSGNILVLNAVEATLTTGNYINCYDGAASDFTVAKYGATTIAGNAATTVFTITAGHALLTSGNLTLTSGNVVLTAGNLTLTSGDATLTSGNLVMTSGNLTITAGYLLAGVQSLNGPGAVDVTHLATTITTTGADALTLGDGAVGQYKSIVMIVKVGNATLTPTNLYGFTTITFTAVGQGVLLQFVGTKWIVVANNGATLA